VIVVPRADRVRRLAHHVHELLQTFCALFLTSEYPLSQPDPARPVGWEWSFTNSTPPNVILNRQSHQ
jgi:hypothetical protein